MSTGSGVIVAEDGWIIAKEQRTEVELRSASRYDAAVKDVGQKLDDALIKIEPDVSVHRFPSASLTASE